MWLPADAEAADEEPDRRYAEGDVLPGGLVAVRTPGPEWPHYSFLLEREPGVVFCSDLIGNRGGGVLDFVPPQFHEDPAETRRSVERLLDLSFSVLCLDHGVPITDEITFQPAYSLYGTRIKIPNSSSQPNSVAVISGPRLGQNTGRLSAG